MTDESNNRLSKMPLDTPSFLTKNRNFESFAGDEESLRLSKSKDEGKNAHQKKITDSTDLPNDYGINDTRSNIRYDSVASS
jgi:hypothetical protein